MFGRWHLLVWMILLLGCAVIVEGEGPDQDAKQMVAQAVHTELAADAADHTHWLFYDVDRKPGADMKQWVAETASGDLERVMEKNGQAVLKDESRGKIESFIHDPSAQAKQHKNGQHDDKQATEMLSMLPQAFLWAKTGTQGNNTVLHFKPDPQFHPPSYQARVFAAMEGDMTVENTQHRIVSLKGRLIHDVKFGGGLFGNLEAGGSFNVERRELGNGQWQIIETHVHIQGRALLFKSISEQEDEQKSKFKQLGANVSLADAEKELLGQQ